MMPDNRTDRSDPAGMAIRLRAVTIPGGRDRRRQDEERGDAATGAGEREERRER